MADRRPTTDADRDDEPIVETDAGRAGDSAAEPEADAPAASADDDTAVSATEPEPEAPWEAQACTADEPVPEGDSALGDPVPPGEAVGLDQLGLAGAPDEVTDAVSEESGEADELKAIVEALVFASPEPLSVKALARILDGEARASVTRALASLKQDYEQHGGLQFIEVAGGYQIVTRPDLNEWVRRLFHERKTTKLSVAALETLAVIAYRQPVTAAEIAEIRGVNTSGVLATLVERKLIKIAGRKNVVGRPFLYATTREFLLRFGLNDVSDLPRVEEMADALGFDLPAALSEPMPSDQFLPLDEPETVASEPTPDQDEAGETDAAADPDREPEAE